MKRLTTSLLALGVIAASASPAAAQGLIAPTAGPINAAMAGASTAAPVDVGGSYWNPAILSGLPRSEVLIGAGLFLPSTHLQTVLPAGAIRGVFPPENRFGLSRSDSGVAAGPAVALAFRLVDDSKLTYGLGLFGLAGGNVNYAGSNTQPVLTAHDPPRSFGVGPIFGNAAMLAVAPMASYAVTDRLSVGGGPVITSTALSLDPAFFAPGRRDEFGLPSFPAATHARPFWGGGFQLGLFSALTDSWNVGFSYKSPVWQERWGFNATTPNLSARRIGIQAAIPQIFSWGVAYKGLPNTLLDVDFRFFDYDNAALFGQRVIDGGLGWRSIFAVACGAQYRVSDRLTVRAGYLYNQNPIPDPVTLFNVQLPGIITNTLALGATVQLTEHISTSVAWQHGFRNSLEGPILEIPGTSVKFDTQVDSIQVGLTIQFGGPRKAKPVARSDAGDPAASPQG